MGRRTPGRRSGSPRPPDDDAVWADREVSGRDEPSAIRWWSGDDEASPDHLERDVDGSVDVVWPGGDGVGGASGDGSGRPTEGSGVRRRRLLLAAAAGVAAVTTAVLAAVWTHDDARPVADPAVTDPAPVTLDDLVGPGGPDTTIADEPVDVDGDVDVDVSGGDTDTGVLDPDVVTPGADLRPYVVDLPDRLATSAAPTEIVVMTTDLGLATLSLPSGRVRYAALSDGLPRVDGGPLVVADDGAVVVSGTGSSTAVVVPRVGPPIAVPAPEPLQGFFPNGRASTAADGSTVFPFFGYGPDGPERRFEVGLDGSVRELDADDATPFFGFDLGGADGGPLLNDAGGLYRRTDVGVERISDGIAVTAAGANALVRTCDDARVCGHVVLDVVTGATTPVSPAATTDLENSSYLLELSPDGRAVSSARQGSDGRPTVRIVDLADGSVVEGPPGESLGPVPTSSWLSDGSGVVQIGDTRSGGLMFLDRTTGDVVPFATELGPVAQIGVRSVDEELPADPPIVVERDIDVDIDLPPTGLDLVAVGRFATMAFVDLDERTAAAWAIPAVSESLAPEVVASGDVVAVLGVDGTDGVLARWGSGEELGPDSLPLSPGPRFGGPEPGLVWTPRTVRPDVVDHRLTTVDGTLPVVDGATVAIDGATLLGGDGRGRLVARIGGSVSLVGGGEPTLLTDGELLALGTGHALVRSCDDALACSVDLVDRTTGTVLEPRPDVLGFFGVAEAAVGVDGPPLAGTVSPDGRSVIGRTVDTEGDEQWFVVDLVGGTRTSLPRPADRQPFVWSDDGAVLVYPSGIDLLVWDRASASVSPVVGLGEVRAVARVTDEFRAGTPDT